MATLSFTWLNHVKLPSRLLLSVLALLLLGGSFGAFFPRMSDAQAVANLEKDVLEIQHRLDRFLAQIKLDLLDRGSRFLAEGSCEIRQADEVFVKLVDGQLENYCGETSYWGIHENAVGTWIFREQRGDLYYIYRLSDDGFYIRKLWRLNDVDASLFAFSLPQVACSFSIANRPAQSRFNAISEQDNLIVYFQLEAKYSQWLHGKASLSLADMQSQKNRQVSRLLIGIILFVLGILFWLRWRRRDDGTLAWQRLFEEWLLLLTLARVMSFFHFVSVQIPWFTGDEVTIDLVLLLAILSGLIRTIHSVSRRRQGPMPGMAALGTVLFTLSVMGYKAMLVTAGFPVDRFAFSLSFLMILAVGAAMMAIPLLLLQLDSLRHGWLSRLGVVLVLPVLIFLLMRLQINGLWLPTAAALALNLIFKQGSKWQWLNLVIMALMLQILLTHSGLTEKKDYIEDNLAAIFLNQGNYAKSVAREMVHEINASVPDMRVFFYPEEGNFDLAVLWEQSLAAKENIPSGIFICDSQNKIINHISYMIPFLDLGIKDESLFPFWAISQTTSSLYGRPTSVAYASIKVLDGGRFLGTIYIEVLNTSTLILKDRSLRHIFALNPRIEENEIGFLRVDEAGRIVENPYHLTFRQDEIEPAQKSEWKTLVTEKGTILAYRFPYDEDQSIYLYIPLPSLIHRSAELMKLLVSLGVFWLLLLGLPSLKLLITNYYRTFSFKVLLILLLLTLGTALTLTLSAFNFYHTAAAQNQQLTWYEQGRVAQNLTINFFEKNQDVGSEALILLGQLLNGEVSVYHRGELQDSSNYRRIIAGEIPQLISSRIQNELQTGAEGLILDDHLSQPRILYRVNEMTFMLELGSGWQEWNSDKNKYTDFLINIMSLIALVGTLMVVFVRNHILSPINRLNAAMSEVERGHLVHLPLAPAEAELKQLFSGFNAMVSGVAEQQRSVSEMARMKTLIKMGRRVAHEVKNPLTPIKLSAEQIQRALQDRQPGCDEIILRAVRFIMEETDHLKRVSYGFLDLSKMDELEAQTFDLLELIRQEIFAFQQVATSIRFGLECCDPQVEVCLDRMKIKQILKNLIQNAVEAVGDQAGQVVIGVDAGHISDKQVAFWVKDDGCGMSEELIQQVFDEDFTHKDAGFGIGLFIVKRVVDLHHGQIRVDSRPGEGTTISIEVPFL